MDAAAIELEQTFDKKMPELISALRAWFEEETTPIDGVVDEADVPSGEGGSIVGMRPAIDSKRVVDATVITKKVLGIPLPPAIIKPGGYNSCEEMIDDIVPKLKKVFTGEIKVRTPKPVKQPEAA
ncbi:MULTISPECIES: hypothetical protein [unclassified Afipia]|uniref:hypothetical protein n=1 Tax=unclassified Afipia TaxID=2642050 RepID=UPI00041F57B3|nr:MULTISPECIES: hypothetical protein [unclassified Afipia]